MRTWLFNNGIQCIDFPPYSPDLNPIENLWADLARRVEKFQCDSMEELQDIVAEQWKETDKELLRKLARNTLKEPTRFRCAKIYLMVNIILNPQ